MSGAVVSPSLPAQASTLSAPTSPEASAASSSVSSGEGAEVLSLEARIAASKAKLRAGFAGQTADDDGADDKSGVADAADDTPQTGEGEGEGEGEANAEQIAELTAKVEQAEQRAQQIDQQWRDVAKNIVIENKVQAARIEILESALTDLGYGLDESAEEMLTLRAEVIASKVGAIKPQAKQEPAPTSPQVQAEVAKLRESLTTAAKTFKVDERELFTTWNAMRDAGVSVSLEDVARTVAAAKGAPAKQAKHAATAKQVATSRKTVTPIKGTSAGAPTPDLSTPAGRRRHLESLGLVKDEP